MTNEPQKRCAVCDGRQMIEGVPGTRDVSAISALRQSKGHIPSMRLHLCAGASQVLAACGCHLTLEGDGDVSLFQCRDGKQHFIAAGPPQ